MNLKRLILCAGLAVAPAASLAAVTTVPSPATAATSTTPTCSGENNDTLYDVSTHGYVGLAPNNNKVVANLTAPSAQWSTYLDGQKTSPEYGEFSFCNMLNGHWMEAEGATSTPYADSLFRADSPSPWTHPKATFFKEICGSNHEFMLSVAGHPGYYVHAEKVSNQAAQLVPSSQWGDWFTLTDQCGAS